MIIIIIITLIRQPPYSLHDEIRGRTSSAAADARRDIAQAPGAAAADGGAGALPRTGARAALEGGEGAETGGVELPPHPPVAGGTEGVEGG